MQWGVWKLTCDKSDRRTLWCTKPGFEFYYINLNRIRNSAGMLDWIFQVKGKSVIGPQEMYDLLTAFHDIFQPQQTLCSGGNDHQIEAFGE
jgi:hypothetical protein